MSKNIEHPSVGKVIEYNLLILNLIKVKRADKAEVLSEGVISRALKETKEMGGDIYERAVCLLRGLIQGHAFASGNSGPLSS